MSKIFRVFPRQTNATPTDDLSAIDRLPHFKEEADYVHISVAFTWDMQKAESLAKEWGSVAPVSMGGPAFNQPGGEFVPGRYLEPGYVITSRGCPNRCWFCSVWKREGPQIRELPITDGWNVHDDNILACSESHIRAVFEMLRRQDHPIDFSGGWEAARLKDWHIELLKTIRLNQVWFAYDTEDDYEPLVRASRMLEQAEISREKKRCYVLIGDPKDTMESADARLRRVWDLGFIPMAMLYRNNQNETTRTWRRFQRCWAMPGIIRAMCTRNEKARM